jgi:hypothetical protein
MKTFRELLKSYMPTDMLQDAYMKPSLIYLNVPKPSPRPKFHCVYTLAEYFGYGWIAEAFNGTAEVIVGGE